MRKLILFFIVIIMISPYTVLADSSKAALVMDLDSGRIIYKKNENDKMLIASTTKIMTCLIVLENIKKEKLNKKVTVGDEIINTYGTNIYLEEGEKIKIIDLLYGLILRSGNDAAEVLANNTFKDRKTFIKKMNIKAKELKMNNTIFENPHGLDDNTMNYSTAYDMALLAKYTYKNKLFRKIISTKKYSTKTNKKSYLWINRMNLLNDYKYSLGGKNGYTPKAGKSLVSFAKKNGLNLLIVTLDDNDIYNNHKYLYEKYFSIYKKYSILDKNNFKISKNIIKDDVYIKDNFVYPLTEEEVNSIITLVRINNHSNNNIVGNIIIKLDNEEIGNINIYKKTQKKRLFSR